jgi:exonuclease III
LQKHLLNLKEKQKPVILAGDLNVAHHEIDVYDPLGVEG